MASCTNCGGDRIIEVSGKTSDLCFVSFKNQESDGYVPDDIGIGGGDYLEFDYCADCGCIQDKAFPLGDIRLNDEEDEDELDEED